MLLFIYLFWLLNLVIGLLLFMSCYRTSATYFFLLNTMAIFLVFYVHLKLFSLVFLHQILVYTPVFIGLAKIFIDKTAASRSYEKNLSKIILFLDLIGAKIRFGRGIRESICSSEHIITQKSHVKFYFETNVVLQQPKSRFFPLFRDLEHDLNTILVQKVGQRDLIEHIKKKYQRQLSLHQKAKIALSQYKAQSFVISLFWLSAILFLIVQGLFLTYIKTVLLSFSLLCFGFYMSRKLLIKTEFRI